MKYSWSRFTGSKFVMLCGLFSGFLMAAASPAFAHDMWFEKEGDGYKFYCGHLAPEPGEERLMQLDISKIKYLNGIDAKGTKKDILSLAAAQDKAIKIPHKCGAMSLFYYGGFYSILLDGEEKNLPKNKVDKIAIKSWESKEFVKYIDSIDKCDTAFGDEFEIVPLKDIKSLSQGDKLNVRVLYKGKPVENAIVAYKAHVLGTTDEKGGLRLKLRDSGLQSIEAGLSIPVNSPET